MSLMYYLWSKIYLSSYILLSHFLSNAQSVFSVYPTDQFIHDTYDSPQGGKVWFEIFAGVENGEDGPYQIELNALTVRMVDFEDYGYTETKFYDDNNLIREYNYTKIVDALPALEALTDVTYYYIDSETKKSSSGTYSVTVRVKNLNTNEYLEDVYSVNATQRTVYFNYYYYSEFLDGHTLWDYTTNNEGTNVFYAHDPTKAPGVQVKGAWINSYVKWNVHGKVFIDRPVQFEGDEYRINGTTSGLVFHNIFDPDNPAPHPHSLVNRRASEILLQTSSSVLEIKEDTHLRATGLEVKSGTGGMAGGIVGYPGSKIMLDNTMIEDQITGITLIGDATLELNNVYFTDNEVAIRVKPGSPGEVTKIVMEDTHFTGTGNLKTRPNNRMFPYAHIIVEPGARVDIQVNGGDNSVRMYQAEYGIFSEGNVRITGGTIDYTYSGFQPLTLGSFNAFGVFEDPIHSDIVGKYYTPATPGIGIRAGLISGDISTLNVDAENETKPLRINGARIGIVLNRANSLIRYADIKEAIDYGVYIASLSDHIVYLHRSVIESKHTGVYVIGNNDSYIEISKNTIDATYVGVDKLICRREITNLFYNTIRSQQYGLRSRINYGDGYIGAISNEFHAYSLNSNLFLNTAAILKQTSYKLRAEDNDILMKGAKYGVKLLRTNRDLILNNNIKFKMESGQGTYGDGIGIKSQGGESNRILCNTTFQDDVADGSATVAYLSENSPNTTLLHNNTDKVRTGIHFTGNNLSSSVVGNSFNQHFKGILYGTDTQIAHTRPQRFAGNFWSNVQTSVTGYRDAQYLGDATTNDYDMNAYIINPNHNPVAGATMNPAYVSPGSLQWFKTQTTQLNYVRDASCDNTIGAIEEIYALDENTYNRVMRDSIDFGVFDDQIKESYYRYMYRELMKGNIEFSTPGTITYQLGLKGLNTDLVDVHHMIETNLYGAQRTVAELDLLDEKMGILSDAIGLYTLIPDSLGTTREAAWTSILEDFDALMALTDTATVSLSQMESALTGLANRHTYTASETALYTALLGTVRYIKGDTTAYAGMKDDIMDIAISCPYELGEAVYMARALVGDEYPYSHEDFSMCDYDQPLWKKDEAKAVQSTVYPIPSSGRITVEYPEGAERIMIYDLTGKLSYHRALDGKEGILDISLTQAGVYRLQVLKANNEMEVRKIVIVK